jgi:hypothetical protein
MKSESELNEKQLPILHRNLFKYGVWTKEYINELIKEPSEPEDYPNALVDLDNCLQKINLKNKKILVVGSITPWIECYLLKLGADKIYITDINPIEIEDSRIVFTHTDNIKEKYDIIISFSSVEHIGLGRYGDPIDDEGDIKFMSYAYDILTNKGIFLLGIPVAKTYKIDGHWHRIYDETKLNTLLEKYQISMSSKNNIISEKIDFSFDNFYSQDWQNQPFILLRKK